MKSVFERNQTDVALSITKHVLLKEYQNKNIVFSPLSLHVVLSMLAAGSARTTLHELLTFLRAKSTDDLNSLASHLASVVLCDAAPAGGPNLCFANSAWVEQSLNVHHSFKQLITADYKANLASVDFRNKADEVVNEVNLWAEKNTKGLIKNILSPESANSSTSLILANALYFKGGWEEEFDALRTSDGDFHLLDGTSVKVPFMTSSKDQFIGEFDGFKVLGLPYKNGFDKREFSMYIFLPDANDGLPALIEQVISESGFLEHHLPHEKVEVGTFRIPKFKISFKLEASDLLRKMGMVLPFSPDDADFTKIVKSGPENLYVSKITQKSFIEVNEEGTEVAAVTVSEEMCGCSMYSTYSNFVADHPFMFLIRERFTGTILFIGQVLHPLHE